MQELYVLSQDDIGVLRALIDRARRQGLNRPIPLLDVPRPDGAPDVYVALAPGGGIPARAGAVPGVAACEVHKTATPDGAAPSATAAGGLSVTVYNFGTDAVPAGTYVLVVRDKWGVWSVAGAAGGGGGATPPVIHTVTPSLTGDVDASWDLGPAADLYLVSADVEVNVAGIVPPPGKVCFWIHNVGVGGINLGGFTPTDDETHQFINSVYVESGKTCFIWYDPDASGGGWRVLSEPIRYVFDLVGSSTTDPFLFALNGRLVLSKGDVFGTFAGDTTLTPSGFNCLHICGAGVSHIHGIAAGVNGQPLYLTFASVDGGGAGSQLILEHENAGATTAADRIYCPGRADVTLTDGMGCLLRYCDMSSNPGYVAGPRWLAALPSPGATGGGGGGGLDGGTW